MRLFRNKPGAESLPCLPVIVAVFAQHIGQNALTKELGVMGGTCGVGSVFYSTVRAVAAPPHEAWLIAHVQRGILRFRAKTVDKPVFVFGILSACHEEILGDHDAKPAALVIEMGGFESSAAPDPQHVQTALSAEFQCPGDLLVGAACVVRFARNPVGAFAENPLS